MAEYILDTNHLSYIQERNPSVIGHLLTLLPGDRVMTSVVSMAELLRGVYLLPLSRRRRELLHLYRQAMEQMTEILPITAAVAEQFATVDVKLRRKGKPIPTNDVWIAALVISRDAVLVTNDNHFRHVESLKTEDWT